MALTCILVDLENVQLRVGELAALQRGQHLLKVFHGPSQNKLTMDLVRTLQPLGDAVEYIQCEKAGPNALDFHLAFHLGRLTALQPDVRLMIVSRDKGFAQLVSHANRLGYQVSQHAALPVAELKGQPAAPEPTAPKTRAGAARKAATKTATPAPAAPARKAAAKKVPAARKSAPVKITDQPAAPAKKAIARKAAPARNAASANAGAVALREAREVREVANASDRKKALDSLRRMAQKRPTSLKSLQHHLQSHLRSDLSESAVQALVQWLLASGALTLEAGRLTYHLPA